jgi:hypothetical protein
MMKIVYNLNINDNYNKLIKIKKFYILDY